MHWRKFSDLLMARKDTAMPRPQTQREDGTQDLYSFKSCQISIEAGAVDIFHEKPCFKITQTLILGS